MPANTESPTSGAQRSRIGSCMLAGLVWSGLLPGPGDSYICVYVSAAPLQRHPMVAVALRTGVWCVVCVSHGKRANHGGSCCPNIGQVLPTRSHPFRFGQKVRPCRGSSVFRLPSIFFSSHHLRIRVAQNAFAPGAAGGAPSFALQRHPCCSITTAPAKNAAQCNACQKAPLYGVHKIR